MCPAAVLGEALSPDAWPTLILRRSPNANCQKAHGSILPEGLAILASMHHPRATCVGPGPPLWGACHGHRHKHSDVLWPKHCSYGWKCDITRRMDVGRL